MFSASYTPLLLYRTVSFFFFIYLALSLSLSLSLSLFLCFDTAQYVEAMARLPKGKEKMTMLKVYTRQ